MMTRILPSSFPVIPAKAGRRWEFSALAFPHSSFPRRQKFSAFASPHPSFPRRRESSIFTPTGYGSISFPSGENTMSLFFLDSRLRGNDEVSAVTLDSPLRENDGARGDSLRLAIVLQTASRQAPFSKGVARSAGGLPEEEIPPVVCEIQTNPRRLTATPPFKKGAFYRIAIRKTSSDEPPP